MTPLTAAAPASWGYILTVAAVLALVGPLLLAVLVLLDRRVRR